MRLRYLSAMQIESDEPLVGWAASLFHCLAIYYWIQKALILFFLVICVALCRCIIILSQILGYHSFCKPVPNGKATASPAVSNPLQNDCSGTSTLQTPPTSENTLIAISVTSAAILIIGLFVLVGLLIRKERIFCFKRNEDYRPFIVPMHESEPDDI